MDLLKFINDKHDVLAKLADSTAKVQQAFHGQGGGDNPTPQLDAIAKGYKSSAFLLQILSELELLKVFQGQPLSSALISRLLSINLGDFAHGSLGREVDVPSSLVKLFLEEEVRVLQTHGEQIVDAGKGIQNLLLLLAAGLFENLLAQTAKEEPEIREFFQGSGAEDLTDYIVITNPRHVGNGGYADVFETELLRPPSQQPRKVAVKVIRISQADEDDAKKAVQLRRRLHREIKIWQSLSHFNIVPMLGLTHRFNKSLLPSIVCAWMAGGTLSTHLKAKKATLTLHARYKLLRNVIDGLYYLHSQNVIHGDLTTGNILMSQNMACLSDFGLSKVVGEQPVYLSSNVVGTYRWAAPELFGFNSPITITKKCDIYSYGCIVHEVISTLLPYYNIKADIKIATMKMERVTSERPLTAPFLTDDVWDFIQLCWRDDPRWRPDVDQVSDGLKEIVQQYSQEELAAILPAEVDVLELSEAGLELD